MNQYWSNNYFDFPFRQKLNSQTKIDYSKFLTLICRTLPRNSLLFHSLNFPFSEPISFLKSFFRSFFRFQLLMFTYLRFWEAERYANSKIISSSLFSSRSPDNFMLQEFQLGAEAKTRAERKFSDRRKLSLSCVMVFRKRLQKLSSCKFEQLNKFNSVSHGAMETIISLP